MKIPGFAADASLGRTMTTYLLAVAASSSISGGGVIPQQTHDFCFLTHAGYICCHCTPQDGCSCHSPGMTEF